MEKQRFNLGAVYKKVQCIEQLGHEKTLVGWVMKKLPSDLGIKINPYNDLY